MEDRDTARAAQLNINPIGQKVVELIAEYLLLH